MKKSKINNVIKLLTFAESIDYDCIVDVKERLTYLDELLSSAKAEYDELMMTQPKAIKKAEKDQINILGWLDFADIKDRFLSIKKAYEDNLTFFNKFKISMPEKVNYTVPVGNELQEFIDLRKVFVACLNELNKEFAIYSFPIDEKKFKKLFDDLCISYLKLEKLCFDNGKFIKSIRAYLDEKINIAKKEFDDVKRFYTESVIEVKEYGELLIKKLECEQEDNSKNLHLNYLSSDYLVPTSFDQERISVAINKSCEKSVKFDNFNYSYTPQMINFHSLELLDFNSSSNIFIQSEKIEDASEILANIGYKFLSSYPVKYVQIAQIKGNSDLVVAETLRDVEGATIELSSGWKSNELDAINDIVNDRLATLQMNGCKSIVEYNKRNPHHAISLINCLIHNYKNGEEESEIMLLKNLSEILERANKVGIYFVVAYSTHDKLLQKLPDCIKNNTYYHKGGTIAQKDGVEYDFNLRKNFNLGEFINHYKEQIKSFEEGQVHKIPTLYFKDLIKNVNIDTSDFSKKLIIPIGKQIDLDSQGTDCYKDLQYLTLDTDLASNVTVTGMAGSGKSSVLHSIILGACSVYSKEQLEISIFSLKEGLGYESMKMPQVKQIVYTMGEDAVKMAEKLLDMLDEDARAFGRYNVETLSSYNEIAKERGEKLMPRKLIIIDETQELRDINGNVDEEIVGRLTKIADSGRKLGYSIIFTQLYHIRELNAVYKQCRHNIILKLEQDTQNNDTRSEIARSYKVDVKTFDVLDFKAGSPYRLALSIKDNEMTLFQPAFLTDKSGEYSIIHAVNMVNEKWKDEVKTWVVGSSPEIYVEDDIAIENLTISQASKSLNCSSLSSWAELGIFRLNLGIGLYDGEAQYYDFGNDGQGSQKKYARTKSKNALTIYGAYDEAMQLVFNYVKNVVEIQRQFGINNKCVYIADLQQNPRVIKGIKTYREIMKLQNSPVGVYSDYIGFKNAISEVYQEYLNRDGYDDYPPIAFILLCANEDMQEELRAISVSDTYQNQTYENKEDQLEYVFDPYGSDEDDIACFTSEKDAYDMFVEISLKGRYRNVYTIVHCLDASYNAISPSNTDYIFLSSVTKEELQDRNEKSISEIKEGTAVLKTNLGATSFSYYRYDDVNKGVNEWLINLIKGDK